MKEKIDIHAKLIDEINNSFRYIYIFLTSKLMVLYEFQMKICHFSSEKVNFDRYKSFRN